MIEMRWKKKDMNYPELGDVQVCTVGRGGAAGMLFHYAVLQFREGHDSPYVAHPIVWDDWQAVEVDNE